MPTWWFVRHGESQAQTGEWDGPDQETPLSRLGEQQADALAPAVAELPVQRVLVSPYLRARQTAERAMAKWGLAPQVPDPISSGSGKATGTSASLQSQSPFQVVHDLRERVMGEEYRRRYYEPEVSIKLATWDFTPPNGESIVVAAGRAIRALAVLDGPHNTIVFAHGRILAGVLTLLDGADPSAGVEPIANCAPVTRELPVGAWASLVEKLG